MREMLKSKIHRCRVTATNPEYSGSIVIDQELMEKADLLEFEKVLIGNASNGQRWETYVIPGERGSGTIAAQGPCARLCQTGDMLVIQAYELTDTPVRPKLVLVDERNRFVKYID